MTRHAALNPIQEPRAFRDSWVVVAQEAVGHREMGIDCLPFDCATTVGNDLMDLLQGFEKGLVGNKEGVWMCALAATTLH